MTHPTITFVDDQGALPYRDGAQFTVQYERADWWVRLSQPWQGRVVIDGPEPLELTRRYGATGTEWIVPPLRDDLRVHVDAGQVRVMLVDRDGHRLPNSPSAVLNILAANVDEAEMSHMLERIALLAVSAASHTTAIMPLPSVEPLGEHRLSQRFNAGQRHDCSGMARFRPGQQGEPLAPGGHLRLLYGCGQEC